MQVQVHFTTGSKAECYASKTVLPAASRLRFFSRFSDRFFRRLACKKLSSLLIDSLIPKLGESKRRVTRAINVSAEFCVPAYTVPAGCLALHVLQELLSSQSSQ